MKNWSRVLINPQRSYLKWSIILSDRNNIKIRQLCSVNYSNNYGLLSWSSLSVILD